MEAGDRPTDELVVDEETLELDELNSHECMMLFLKLLNFLHKLREKEESTEMPGWMRHLHTKIMAPETKANVKFFIARLVVNRPHVFQPFGQEWLRCVSLSMVERNGSEGVYKL